MADNPGAQPMQARVLAFVRLFVAERGFPPTVREIGAAVGLKSPSSVAHHLRSLERQGLIRRAGGARALQTDEPAERIVRIPVLGAIAAGVPIPAEQSADEQIAMPRSMVGGGTLFALRVRGDSMVGAAICDGDTVVVRQLPVAETG